MTLQAKNKNRGKITRKLKSIIRTQSDPAEEVEKDLVETNLNYCTRTLISVPPPISIIDLTLIKTLTDLRDA